MRNERMPITDAVNLLFQREFQQFRKERATLEALCGETCRTVIEPLRLSRGWFPATRIWIIAAARRSACCLPRRNVMI
jgi:hypothetical protein